MGHVWTAPWQEPSDVAATLVGCGHVSGLLMRQERPLDGSPQSGALQRNHSYGTPMPPGVGAVHSIKRVGFVMSAICLVCPNNRHCRCRSALRILADFVAEVC